MNIIIRNASDDPIYVQIKEQLKREILLGTLLPDQQLPSIRNLAKELRISVITTKKAYDELENEGFVHSVPGKGVFVAHRDPQLQREEHLRQIEEHLMKALDIAELAGISKEDIVTMLQLVTPTDQHESSLEVE
ncbi:MAG TPA: GntR family transcriptional regulator [Tissierellia bacterium]|jgi:GntR family transcriptional regulator|nr:GntR family transcriptional regulator [Tissierellia bacterium]